MSMTSYAQNREDVVLDRAFPRGRPGLYVDIGANDPVRGSVTKHFYDLGWHGINVEPAAHPFHLLAQARPRDVNLNVAASDEEGEVTLFELPAAWSGGSTLFEPALARHVESGLRFVERKVPATTLARICEEHVGDREIDFLSVDVEGSEERVLRGADWTRWRPRIVLVEATEPTTTIPAHEPWEPILLDAGYVFAAFDGLNRWYVRKEDAELTEVVRVPANTLDDYAPYEHVKLQMDLQASVEQLRVLLDESTGREAAARAVNQSLLLDIAGFAHETSALRSAYERLERALTSTRARLEELREQLAASEAGARDLERHLDAARAQLSDQMAPPAADPLPEGVSPASLAVARRLTAMAARHPVVAERIKVGLRAGLRMKRRIRPG